MKKSHTFKFSCQSITLSRAQFKGLVAMDYFTQPARRTGDALCKKGLVEYHYPTRHPGGCYQMTNTGRAMLERVETGRIDIPSGW